MPIERKLAAIMFTDIAGYTAQMAKDESVAISLLNKKESILKPLITKHNGTYVKSTGDGSLSHFNSAVDAATCAKRFQESIYDNKDLNVRVGVHLGDTIFEKGDIRGDGVNIAARLESMAVEGGVFVSKEVNDQLTNQKEFEGVSLGLQSMKGVGRLIEVYGLKGDRLSEPNPNEYQDNKVVVHSDDEVPSIAIIPFDNKGADEDVFYAYGISADLISDCSGAGLIRVASLKDIENLDYKTLDTSEFASKLFVRYIAQGTLWKMDNMFQLSVELYDTKDKKVVWSDRWQENWDEFPDIKRGLSEGLIKALNTNTKIKNKIDTHDKKAYEYFLKARYKYRFRQSIEDIEIVRELLIKAIDIDNNFFHAIGLLAHTYYEAGKFNKAVNIYNDILIKAKNNNDLQIICSINYGLSGIYSYRGGDYNKSLNCEESNLIIYKKTNNQHGIARSLSSIGLCYRNLGNYEKALKYYDESYKIEERLGNHVNMAIVLGAIGNHYLNVGKYDKSLEYNFSSLKLLKEINHFRWITYAQNNLGETLIDMKEYQDAINHLDKAYNTRNKLNLPSGHILISATLLALAKKNLNNNYNNSEIKLLIKRAELIKHDLNYRLYLLIEDTSYIKTAYNQIQETADNLEADVATKFLSYPIPKAIVEEWEKVK